MPLHRTSEWSLLLRLEVKAETLNPKWKEEAKKLHEWSAKATSEYTAE